jgi:phosphoribosylanthranilate isomerase
VTFVKICGIRTVEHGLVALEAGADFLGFVFYRPSPRYVDPRLAAEIVSVCRSELAGRAEWRAVGVFVDERPDRVNAIVDRADLDYVQVCGGEDRAYCLGLPRPAIRVVHVDGAGALPDGVRAERFGAERLLLDTKVAGRYGGTGTTYRWQAVGSVAARSFLAGGLTPLNVGDAIAAARPWAVDVSSGVERDGTKDPTLIEQFIREVRRVDRGAD